jgi:hypothetical protein
MLSALNVSCQSLENWFLANQIRTVSRCHCEATSLGIWFALGFAPEPLLDEVDSARVCEDVECNLSLLVSSWGVVALFSALPFAVGAIQEVWGLLTSSMGPKPGMPTPSP